MKICTSCHTENPEEALLCSACGADLTKKYIRRHRVRRKHRRSRAAGNKKPGFAGTTLGVLFLTAFVLLIILLVYFSLTN